MDRETLQSYLSQARGEGKFDSAGTFTIDYAEAREKLATYQFQRPEYYLLKFVQAAVGMKSKALEFRFASDSIEVRFVSPQAKLPPEQFGALVTDKHDAHVEQHCRDLALAVCGSGASTVCFRDTGSGREVNVRGDSLDFTELGSLRGDSKFLFFLGRDHPFKKSEILNKEKVLKAACQFTPIPISIDGMRINSTGSELALYRSCIKSRFPIHWGEAIKREDRRSGIGLPADGRLARVQLVDNQREVREEGDIWVSLRDEVLAAESAMERARLLLLASGPFEGASKLWLVQYGVVVAERSFGCVLPGLKAVLCVDGHPTDLSGFQLRESEILEQELREVEALAVRLKTCLTQELQKSKPAFLNPPIESGPSVVVGGVVVGGLLGLVAGPYGSVFGACSGAALGKAFLRVKGRARQEPTAYLAAVLGVS